jgi:GAF domain-containing protein
MSGLDAFARGVKAHAAYADTRSVSSPLPERAAQALARETSVPGLVQATCRAVVELLDASACTLSRVIGDLLVDLVEYPRRGVAHGHGYLIADYPLTQEVLEQKEPRTVSLLDDDPEPNEARLLEEFGFASLLMLPLQIEGHCWGLVEVYAGGSRRFVDADAALAERVVAHAGELLEELERGAAAA